jgi:hypothetical protein
MRLPSLWIEPLCSAKVNCNTYMALIQYMKMLTTSTHTHAHNVCYHVHNLLDISLASEYGLGLRFKKGFHEFYQEAVQEEPHNKLLWDMKVVGGDKPEMDEEQWEAAGT